MVATLILSLALHGQKPTDFSDKVFKVPIYPGATAVPGTSQRLGIDKPQGWATTFQSMPNGWGRTYESKDNIKKVGAFYRTELAKIGKLHEVRQNNPTGFILLCKLKTGDHISMRGSWVEYTGRTRFELYYALKSGK